MCLVEESREFERTHQPLIVSLQLFASYFSPVIFRFSYFLVVCQFFGGLLACWREQGGATRVFTPRVACARCASADGCGW